jgi:hypothetical protein
LGKKKILAKNWRFGSNLGRKNDHNIGFEEKRFTEAPDAGIIYKCPLNSQRLPLRVSYCQRSLLGANANPYLTMFKP